MRTSDKGRSLIKSYEGFSHKAYRCPAGVWTIGFGTTGPDIKPSMLVTTAEANALFDKALEKFEDAVNRVKWPINQSQFDALVSLTYNIGISAFLSSTLLRYLNQGNVLEASNQFLAWCKINGQRCPGLLTRREKERELFLKGA